MRVKICGIRSGKDVETALRGGADALGFLVGITHVADDKITLEDARSLTRCLPPFVSSVAVTHRTESGEIVAIAKYIECSTVQVHADVTEDTLREVRAGLPGIKLLKAVHVVDQSALDYALRMAPLVDALLLDSRTSDRLGGTGLTHDWSVSRLIVEQVGIPVLLAGGLNPRNVEAAVKLVRPYGVDVNSGVETDGWKDLVKVSEFVSTARAASLTLATG